MRGPLQEEVGRRPGQITEAAARRFYDKSYAIADEVGALDSWSEGNVRTLALAAQREARLFLQRVLNAGLNARIISGTRTYAWQNQLFRMGRRRDTRSKGNSERGGAGADRGAPVERCVVEARPQAALSIDCRA